MTLQEQIYRDILSTKGKIFTCKFIKKDGTIRVMNCRLGVRKGVKGVGRKFNPEDYGLIGVYDMHKGFRMINTKTVLEITFQGKTKKYFTQEELDN